MSKTSVTATIDLGDITDDAIVAEVVERGLFAEVRDKDMERELTVAESPVQDLVDELESRGIDISEDRAKLSRIYEEFRARGNAPDVLRDYIYERIGRTL